MLYIALRIVFVGYGIWSLVGDVMLSRFDEQDQEKLREQDTALSGDKQA